MAGQDTTPNDYSTKTKAELVELVVALDRSLAVAQRDVKAAHEAGFAAGTEAQKKTMGPALDDLVQRAERAENELAAINDRAQASEKERAAKKAARGVAKHLGKIDVFDTDDPDDVLARAMQVRAGHVPIAMAKRFKTEARMRAPADSGLAKRLNKGAACEVPLGTEFDRVELDDKSVNDLYAAGAIVAVA